MKAIMVMYDSLRRDLLESYGCDWTITPNFKRLAEKSVQFEQCYVGSMLYAGPQGAPYGMGKFLSPQLGAHGAL